MARDMNSLAMQNEPAAVRLRIHDWRRSVSRVPTIMWCPGKVPVGMVCEALATTIDLLPFAELPYGGLPGLNHLLKMV